MINVRAVNIFKAKLKYTVQLFPCSTIINDSTVNILINTIFVVVNRFSLITAELCKCSIVCLKEAKNLMKIFD